MERENQRGERLDRLERALGAVHRTETHLPDLRVDAIMAAVRASAVVPGSDGRFLWRFLSAAAVAAVMLVAVNLYSGALPDTVALSELADSPLSVLVGSTALN